MRTLWSTPLDRDFGAFLARRLGVVAHPWSYSAQLLESAVGVAGVLS